MWVAAGPETVEVLHFSALWVMVGVAMLLWPARVRSLTNPDWRRYEKWPLAGTALVWYRLTGLAAVFIGSTVIYLFLRYQ